MGALDFLFQGQQPIPAPTSQDTSVQFPLWLQNSIYSSIGAASNLASQPYQQYGGPRVAAPSQATQDSWRMAEGSLGGYKPFMDQAGALTSAASKPWSANDVTPFLNPMQNYVTEGLNRNLQQNVLPQIQDRFVASGQSRSPQEAEMSMRAARDTQGAIGESMAAGYGSALNAAMANRGQMLQGGAQMGELGALGQRLNIADIGALGASGQAQDQQRQANLDTAYSDFSEQRAWPYQNLSYLSDIIRGLPTQYGGYTQQQRGTTYNTPGFAPSPFATFISAGYGGKLRRGGMVRPTGGALSYRMAA